MRTNVDYVERELAPSAVRATAASNAIINTISGLGQFKQAILALVVTNAAAAAGDTLDVYVDTSFDAGTTWLNIVHFNQVLGNGADALSFTATIDPAGAAGTDTVATTSDASAAKVRPSIFGDQMRVRHTIVDGGAHGQTFTYSVIGAFKG